MKTSVCHISTVHDLWDVRVFFKECLSLSRIYKVHLVIQSRERKEKQGVEIIPLKTYPNRFIRILFAPWPALIKALRTKSRLFHLHDPELLVIAPILRCFGKIVIFDKHENVDGQILSKHWLGPFWLRKVVSKSYLMIEYLLLFFCQRVVIVIPEMNRPAIRKKTILVRNYASAELFGNIEIPKHDRFSVIYVGGLTKIRGALQMIKAFELSGVEGDLYLAGKWESKAFEKECKGLIKKSSIHDLGFLEINEVYSHLAQCHVGLCLLHPVQNFIRSIPVKVFEYYFSSQEVILSDFSYWKILFGERAKYVNPLNEDEITKAIQDLSSKFRDEELSDHSSWARQNYSWESEFEKLSTSYSELLS